MARRQTANLHSYRRFRRLSSSTSFAQPHRRRPVRGSRLPGNVAVAGRGNGGSRWNSPTSSDHPREIQLQAENQRGTAMPKRYHPARYLYIGSAQQTQSLYPNACKTDAPEPIEYGHIIVKNKAGNIATSANRTHANRSPFRRYARTRTRTAGLALGLERSL